jgi:hypothetical protein
MKGIAKTETGLDLWQGIDQEACDPAPEGLPTNDEAALRTVLSFPAHLVPVGIQKLGETIGPTSATQFPASLHVGELKANHPESTGS